MSQQLQLPRLSEITRQLTAPETQFESMVKQSLGIQLPPGPMSVILNIQRSIEGAAPTQQPRLPRLEEILPRLPSPAPEQTAPEEKPPTEKLEGEIF